MKTRFVSLLLAWFFSITILVADDYLIVVDATRTMNRFLGKKLRREHVKDALVDYLSRIPENDHRVYVCFFNDGSKETKENEGLFHFKKNEPKGKEAALDYAKKYFNFIAGGRTHLWSSFEKALTHAEGNGFVKLDPNGKLIKAPHIVLLTDGGDDQPINKAAPKKGGWVLEGNLRQPGKPAILDQKEHQWLLEQKRANLIMVDVPRHIRLVLAQGWAGIGPPPIPIGADIPRPFFPPTIVLTDKMGNDINSITAGENVTMKAQGDFNRYRWAIKDKDDKDILVKPLEGDATNYLFKNAGAYTIEVHGTMAGDKQGSIGFKDIKVIQDKFKIIADFTMKHGDNVFQDEGVVWMGDKLATISFDPNKTTTVPADKVKKFVYDWTIKDKNGKKLGAVKDNSADFTVGDVYTIELKATDPKTKQFGVKKKILTLWQVKPAFMAKYGDEPLPDGGTAWMGDNNKIVITLGDETKSSPNLKLDIKWDGKVKVQDGKAIIKEPGKYTFTLTASDLNAPANKIESDPQTFTIKKVVPIIKVAGGKAGVPFETETGKDVKFMWSNKNDFPEGVTTTLIPGDGNRMAVNNGQFNYGYKKPSPKGDPFEAQLMAKLPGGEITHSEKLLILVEKLDAQVRFIPGKPLLGELVELINLNKVANGTTFKWTLGPKPEDVKAGASIKHRFTDPGPNKFTLTIKQPGLEPETSEVTVDVKPVEQMPIAVDHPQKIYIGRKLLFRDESQFPNKANGLKIERTWDFGAKDNWKFWDKNETNGQKTAAIYYTKPGKYEITLEVSLLDDKGAIIPGIDPNPIKRVIETVEAHPPSIPSNKIRLKPDAGK